MLLCQPPQPRSLVPSHGPGALACCPCGIRRGHPALLSPLLLQGCPQRGSSLPSRSLGAGVGPGRAELCGEGLVLGSKEQCGGCYQGPNSFLFLFKPVSFVTQHNKIIFLKS